MKRQERQERTKTNSKKPTESTISSKKKDTMLIQKPD